MRIQDIRAADTYPLRRQVLRDGDMGADVDFDGDRAPTAFHLGAFDDDGALVGVVSFAPFDWAERPGVPAFQLRGMAVAPDRQRGGVGRLLVAGGLERARAGGAQLVWARGRDVALGFYERLGWKAVGDGYLYGPARLPHHTMVMKLP
ncbi:MAG TPA: GNAT family N-acetyltransferase [Acidimicrobiales bacterium]|nr:GNAT family N-acetyltransferase [Acidimicrobiales bacterium]